MNVRKETIEEINKLLELARKLKDANELKKTENSEQIRRFGQSAATLIAQGNMYADQTRAYDKAIELLAQMKYQSSEVVLGLDKAKNAQEILNIQERTLKELEPLLNTGHDNQTLYQFLSAELRLPTLDQIKRRMNSLNVEEKGQRDKDRIELSKDFNTFISYIDSQIFNGNRSRFTLDKKANNEIQGGAWHEGGKYSPRTEKELAKQKLKQIIDKYEQMLMNPTAGNRSAAETRADIIRDVLEAVTKLQEDANVKHVEQQYFSFFNKSKVDLKSKAIINILNQCKTNKDLKFADAIAQAPEEKQKISIKFKL